YMITDMLKDVVKTGTGQIANIPNLPMAGKTGTTDNNNEQANNSWFSGYTKNYSITVWSGYDDNNRALASKEVAQELFKHTMTSISENKETKDFEKPSSVVEVAVEKGTNPPELPSDYTPSENIVTELFVKG